MNMEDISRTPPAALPDCIVIPVAVEIGRESSDQRSSGGAHTEGFMPTPTPPPLWPRVFPGL